MIEIPTSTDIAYPTEDETIREEKTFERHVLINKRTVIKRHLCESELFRRDNGEICYPIWPQERLRNEAATLALVAERTTIPVPKCRLYVQNGVLHLETMRITNGIALCDVGKDVQQTAIAAVDKQLQNDILPQLQSLRRNYVGSVDANLPVFPPQRVYGQDRRSWQRVTSDADEFVLCHNDLAAHNIFVDPDNNFSIVGIIDWEYSGFFPGYFELPLWRETDWSDICAQYDAVKERDLAFFGLKEDDLKNTI